MVGQGTVQGLELDGELWIGSGPGDDIRLEGRGMLPSQAHLIPRRHTCFMEEFGPFWAPYRRRILLPGEWFHVGEWWFVFEPQVTPSAEQVPPIVPPAFVWTVGVAIAGVALVTWDVLAAAERSLNPFDREWLLPWNLDPPWGMWVALISMGAITQALLALGAIPLMATGRRIGVVLAVAGALLAPAWLIGMAAWTGSLGCSPDPWGVAWWHVRYPGTWVWSVTTLAALALPPTRRMSWR